MMYVILYGGVMNNLIIYNGDGHYIGLWYCLTSEECELIRRKYFNLVNVHMTGRGVWTSYETS